MGNIWSGRRFIINNNGIQIESSIGRMLKVEILYVMALFFRNESKHLGQTYVS